MTIERTIRRELRRSGVPVHASRRQARRLAAEVAEAEIRREAIRFGGDLQAARAARQGAAMGESVALGLLDFTRFVSAGMDRLQAHLNGRGA
ncbi:MULTISPECIES: hypothetical protein [unclassified Methylobacterium]|jgi:hypothetical protein|uniref:hypothetical protein n=1 Tax=unclassified Methylobacterium TaxID=2615210 RepID=UPI00135330FC|nr:hypothetical protein [Methylobacterium sp. 2A]MWV22415.1 hypothetical protein [Methylobacterium sp. 2A]